MMKLFIPLVILQLLSLSTTARGVDSPGDSAAVNVFYSKMQQDIVWLTPGKKNNLQVLAGFFRQAPYLGLEERDYQAQFIYAIATDFPDTFPSSAMIAADRQITMKALHFFCDVAYGPVNNVLVRYNGLGTLTDRYSAMPGLLAASLQSDSFELFLQRIEPADTAYAKLKQAFACFYDALTDTGFTETPVISLKADTTNAALMKRLQQLGIADSTAAGGLKGGIIRAQEMFNVLNDGVLRSGFLHELNISFTVRQRELKDGLNQVRWLNAYQPHTMIVVNVPSTGLELFVDNKPVLYSRVITGKKSTPTPTLASRITEVVLYPYWMVPYRIATRELLPHIKRDRHYLDDNQFEVLDRKGRITDPAGINWQSLSTNNFPYVIRQNTGCDNSLGIIKLNFYSPFTVYLHDTPGKSLFMLKQRFFSHGCIRVEDAVMLSRLLLDNASAAMLDTLIKEGPRPDQKPVVIPIRSTVLVFVVYNVAWADPAGKVRFYEDVYKKY